MRWVLCFKRLDFATENALLGLFWGTFTGFYKNTKSYLNENLYVTFFNHKSYKRFEKICDNSASFQNATKPKLADLELKF